MRRHLQALARASHVASALVVGFLLTLAVPAVARGHQALKLTEQERTRFATAVEAFRGGDWRRAVRGFAVTVRRRGLLADYARFFLAEALSRQGHLAAARRTAENLPVRHPKSSLVPAAILQAATLAARQGDESAVERLLRRFLAQFSRHARAPAARYLLGLSLEAQRQDVEAAMTFRELWLTAPASDYGEAAGDRLEQLAAAGVTVPAPSPLERIERAEGLLAGGVRSAAHTEAETVLAELPDPELTLRGLRVVSLARQRGGRYNVAERAAQHALRKVPVERRAPLLLQLAELQRRVGFDEQALRTLGRLLAEHPEAAEVPDALLDSAQLLEDRGRTLEAEAHYRRLVAAGADHPAVHLGLWRLGWLTYLRSDFARAAKEWSRLGALPAAGGYRYPAAYWTARALEEVGETAKAQRIYDLLVNESPRSYYGILAGRRIYRKTGAHGNATAIALPANPFRALAGDARFRKASALSALGLTEFAVSELETILLRSLAKPAKLYALAAAFIREEQYHLALRILRRFFRDAAASGDQALPKAFWEMFYPFGWQREIEQIASRAGVDQFLLAAVVREESSFFPEARSPAGARGLMQLMPGTARAVARGLGLAVADADLLEDPRPNLEIGAAYLAGLLGEFSDVRLATAAYNAGPARVREWRAARPDDDLELFVEQIPFTETRLFVKRVMVAWEEYRRIYDERGALDDWAGP